MSKIENRYMKSIIAVFVFSSCVLVANAQSKLKVSLTDKSQITVALDGKHFQKVGTSITIGDLPEGRHHLMVYQEGKTRFGRKYEDVVFEGKIKTHYGNITIFELDPFTNSINTYEEDIDSFTNNPVIRTDTSGINSNVDNNQQTGVTTNVTHNRTDMGTFSDAKLKALKAKVDDKNADSYKLKTLKEGLIGEKITTVQVSEIMDWLGFESSKSEFAQWAYDITIDKDNFGNLDAKFSYKEYQDEFQDFLKKH